MFAIGEAKIEVIDSKIRIPKEYNLRKKGRIIYGMWIDSKTLYLSDEITPLKAKLYRECPIFKVNFDCESRITVPVYLDNKKAMIRGCISTIEIEFF